MKIHRDIPPEFLPLTWPNSLAVFCLSLSGLDYLLIVIVHNAPPRDVTFQCLSLPLIGCCVGKYAHSLSFQYSSWPGHGTGLEAAFYSNSRGSSYWTNTC